MGEERKKRKQNQKKRRIKGKRKSMSTGLGDVEGENIQEADRH